MRREAGLYEATIRSYHARAGAFPGWLGRGRGTVAGITVADIDRYLSENGAAGGCSAITLRNHPTALRAFFRLAELRGWRAPGLTKSFTAPCVYPDAGLPAGPSADEVRRLLETTVGDRTLYASNRAVLVLLSAYGLRAGEGHGHRLDDLDWQAKTLRVCRSKTGRIVAFPLSRRLGAALLALGPSALRRPLDLPCTQGTSPALGPLCARGHRVAPSAAHRQRLPASRCPLIAEIFPAQNNRRTFRIRLSHADRRIWTNAHPPLP